MSFDAPNGLQQEIENLLNRYNAEKESGTPDFILAQYLTGTLRLFNQTVADRAEWRSEPVDPPALNRISKELRTKKVPLVVYTDGRRNEIGEAEIKEWPGEVRVSGTIEGVIPIVDGVSLDPRGRIY